MGVYLLAAWPGPIRQRLALAAVFGLAFVAVLAPWSVRNTRLQGTFTIHTSSGPREVALAGKADRLDLLDDGTFRLLDYKLGWPPNRARSLQLPIYAVCAEQRLADERGRSWKLGEAAYVAFKGPRRVVPLFASPAERERVLAAAQQRLSDTLDSIARGEFPPRPDDVFRCETCSAAAVCRKDYA
jgi:RecB family exonuclease